MIPKNERCSKCKGTGRRPEGPWKPRGRKPLSPKTVARLVAEGLTVAQIAAKPQGEETMNSMQFLAGRAEGLHYENPIAVKILSLTDWAQHWPVVDASGILTGDVVESDDEYLNVGDMAMVREGSGESPGYDDGYANVAAYDPKLETCEPPSETELSEIASELRRLEEIEEAETE